MELFMEYVREKIITFFRLNSGYNNKVNEDELHKRHYLQRADANVFSEQAN